MAGIKLSDIPLNVPAEHRTAAPSGVLRFFERKDGSRILQQEFAVLTYRDGKPFSRTFEWHDVPLVKDETGAVN